MYNRAGKREQLWVRRSTKAIAIAPPGLLRSVFKITNLFLRPRPWQFEIRDSTDK